MTTAPAAEHGHRRGLYPLGLEREVRTRSGRLVHLRPIRPDDAAPLVAFHGRLSEHSVYLRFFTFHPVLSEQEVERFTRVDYVDRLALVVLEDGAIVAVGRYDRIQGTTDAEVAFVVADGYQGDGLATLLADELAGAAFERGITRFVAETLPENRGMLDVFAGLGFPVSCRFSEGVVQVAFPIDPVLPFETALAEREVGRTVPAGEWTTPRFWLGEPSDGAVPDGSPGARGAARAPTVERRA